MCVRCVEAAKFADPHTLIKQLITKTGQSIYEKLSGCSIIHWTECVWSFLHHHILVPLDAQVTYRQNILLKHTIIVIFSPLSVHVSTEVYLFVLFFQTAVDPDSVGWSSAVKRPSYYCSPYRSLTLSLHCTRRNKREAKTSPLCETLSQSGTVWRAGHPLRI